MLNGIMQFITYLATSCALLASFIFVYIKFTPYHELDLIKKGNSAAGITLAGAVLGFTFPMVSSIFYTQSILEMTLWAAITGVVQLGVFLSIRNYASLIEEGIVAPAIFIASLSIAVGLLNAVCISH